MGLIFARSRKDRPCPVRRPSGPTIDARKLFAEAVALNKAKRSGEAETIARRILASQPDSRQAVNLLGVLRNDVIGESPAP